MISTLKRLMSKAQILRLAPGRGEVVYFAHSRIDDHSFAAAKARGTIRSIRPRARILESADIAEIWHDLTDRLGGHDAVYKLIIESVSEVFALEHAQFVGRGVYHEVAIALANGKPAYAIRDGRAVQIERCTVANPEDYSRRFGRLLMQAMPDKEHHETHRH